MLRSVLLCQPLIDTADLLTPDAPIRVREVQNLRVVPVKVIGNEGYLLVQPVEGVAYDSPAGAMPSTW